MMKKITSFLTMLLMLFVSIGASAQVEDFGLKTVSLGNAIDKFEPNTWYFFHQGRVNGGGDGLCPIGEAPSMGGVMTDMGVGNNLIKRSLEDIPANSLASEKAKYLVRFIPEKEQNDANDIYKIQFASGNYLCAPNGTGNSKTITTTANIYDAGTYNIYFIADETTPGHIGINVCDSRGSYLEQIDNNGVNQTIVTWGSGKKTEATGSNSTWSIVEITWGETDARDAAYNNLVAVLGEYEPLIGNFPTGTQPGQYDAELLEAFKASINAVKELDQNPDVLDSMTAEDFQAMAQAIKDAYEALVASKVPIALADGYYRIKSGLEFYTEEQDEETLETVRTIHDKYMYSYKDGETIKGRWGTPEDLSTDGTALWKVTNVEGGNFDLINMGTDARFDNVTRSTAITMSVPGENVMSIDPATTINGVMYVNIRVATQNGGDGLFLHTGGHSGGAGVAGDLVGWYNTVGESGPAGSEWVFLPVSDEEAQAVMDAYAPIKDRELMLQRYDSLLAVAKEKLDLAIDLQHVNLIKSADQLSSPYSESSEGSTADLLDGSTTTFWHSQWSDGNGNSISVENGIHYLQVDLIQPVEHEIYIYFARRSNAANDHLTQMLVLGTNNPDAEKESCEELLTWDTPFKDKTENFTSAPFDTKSYRYLRLYAPTTTNNRGFWHISELQMSYDIPNENAQIKFMGELGTNLQNVIAAQEGLERDDITINEYNALKTALDAFMTKFTDPTALRQALQDNKDVANVVVVGTQPGYWTNNFGAAAYQILYDEAEAYDAKGDYTPEQSADYVERLTQGAENIFASAIGIQEGKWYRIKFGTEELFEQYGWDKVAGNGTEDGKTEPLFGKYAAACNYFTDEDGYEIHEAIPTDEIGVGQGLYFDDIMDIDDKEMAEFRFINVGDTAYMLQNRATGLFVKANGTSGATRLSAHPTLFNVHAIGCGANVIEAKNINGDAESYLHGQVSGNILVTWDVNTLGSRSALWLEEAGDVKADYDGSTFNILMADGSIGSWCFPIEVSVESNNAQMWGVSSLNGTEVTLCKLDKASAGRPFLLVCGDLEGYDPEVEEEEVVEMKQNFEIGAIEPDNSSALKGTYKSKQIGYGYIVQSGNQLVVSKTSSTTVGANGAYIEGEELFDVEAEVNAVWDESAEDGLTEVINKVRNSGAVYTLDGRLVSKKATLSDVGRMPKGIYILNGVKLVIK